MKNKVFKAYAVNVMKAGDEHFTRFVATKNVDQAKEIFDACMSSEIESTDWVKVELVQIDISITGEVEYTPICEADVTHDGFVWIGGGC